MSENDAVGGEGSYHKTTAVEVKNPFTHLQQQWQQPLGMQDWEFPTLFRKNRCKIYLQHQPRSHEQVTNIAVTHPAVVLLPRDYRCFDCTCTRGRSLWRYLRTQRQTPAVRRTNTPTQLCIFPGRTMQRYGGPDWTDSTIAIGWFGQWEQITTLSAHIRFLAKCKKYDWYFKTWHIPCLKHYYYYCNPNLNSLLKSSLSLTNDVLGIRTKLHWIFISDT